MNKLNPPSLRSNRVFFLARLVLLIAFAAMASFVVVRSAFTSEATNASAPSPFCTTDPVVTNNLDSGAGSLRQAILDACDGSTITFNMAMVISPISLTSDELLINKNLTITGPGATTLTVERSAAAGTPQFRIFQLTSVTANISGLTLTNGHGPDGAPPVGTIGNNGGQGGAIRIASSTVTLSDIRATGNRGGNGSNASVIPGEGGRGGAIYIDNVSLTMTNCTLSGNSGGNGGVSGGNSGTGRGGEGGGIYSQDSTLNLTNVSITNNTGGQSSEGNSFGGSGGGIYTNSNSVATLTSCTVSGNVSGNATGFSGTNGYGGGIVSDGPITIRHSTISGNTTGGTGGAILSRTCGLASISNSTISGNSAASGGAVVNDSCGSMLLVNSTITNNSPQGVSGGSLNVSVRNTIIAGNVGQDAAGNFNSLGNNIIGNASNFAFGFTNGVNGDQVGTDAAPINPGLGPLANNGGPTQTHALMSHSPALDAGNNCVTDNTCSPAHGFTLTTDQRGAGFARAVDSADANTTATVDIGAFEAQASVENIADKVIAEDTPLSFSFNVGGAITSVSASSSNTALVPNNAANIDVTGSGPTRTLNITPVANQSGTSTITVTATAGSDSMSDTFVLTVTPVADTPSVTNATTNEDTQTSSGLVISRNAADGSEVTHFKLSGITNGTLFKNDGTTQINNGDFITFSEGNAGLKFTPAANLFSAITVFSFNIEAATSGTGSGLSPSTTATITVNPIADVPSVTNASTLVNTQTTSGLVITRNAVDGAEVTHFKITNVTNGTLFKNDGTTQIANDSFITVAEASAGLRFTPALNLASPSSSFSFQVQGATSSGGAGLGAAATATITVSCGAAVVTNTNDNGAGSLRQTIKTACPGTVITFSIPTSDPGFSGGVYTIALTSGELVVDKNLNINGPGPAVLTVRRSTADGTPDFRIFKIETATVSLSGMAIMNGKVSPSNNGGGIFNTGTLTLSNSLVIGNLANVGGGIFNDSSGTLNLINSTVEINSASAAAGIFNGNRFFASGSTIGGNTAATVGGGLVNNGGVPTFMTLINTTISHNSTGGVGAGIFNNSTGKLALVHCSISFNVANAIPGPGGGGIFNDGGLISLKNTIVAENTLTNGTGPDLRGAFISEDYNLIGNTTGATFTGTTTHNILNVAANLNTDPTLQVLPFPNSPAINAGDPASLPADAFDVDGDGNTTEALPLDQRGLPRLVGTGFDIGAFETNYTIVATGGTPQSTPINTIFPEQLQVRVTESGNNQFDIPVTFEAPTSGASGNFQGSGSSNTAISGTGGLAFTPFFVANGIAGSYNVTARLAANLSSVNFALTNTKAATTTSLSSSLNPSTFSQTVTFTATVTSSSGTPAGTVQFKAGGVNIGSAQTLTAGSAQFSTSTLSIGTHTITAEYSGDANFLASTGTLSGGQVVLETDILLLLDESGPAVDQIAALESFLSVRDPFRVRSLVNWTQLGPDNNTRLIIFAMKLQLNAGELASAVVVSLVDANSQTHDVPAEDVRVIPNTNFTQVVFRLPDTLASGVCKVTIKAHGKTSNTGTIRITP